ncbi:TetR/AcrR family transcriptional regulator [Pseudoxanthomonas sp. PXM02]|uniref:TetR/AcrR family transcriptional regulator n=1 Tax=Pseudoxanthomonas sp. PXM02 TaxID=2769294 RepID=UPI0017829C82|nr:TetR/AcrR family transcriptional regulator [Pseudoxanthomonas sp. PXM02]MBD9480058.1 TetR/AcrR family transcriptional regulator [Pseudoxanthomonas sp. PXM02]
MNKPTRSYTSDLRRQQADATRARILDAAAALMEASPDGAASVTTKRIAEEAGITEVTLYRHFPSRADLNQALWQHMNDQQGVAGGFPATLAEMPQRLVPLFTSFDTTPAHILNTLVSPTGRDMRSSQNEVRCEAFLRAVQSDNPALADTDRVQAAAVLQLLYSAYSWLSLREQWGLSGAEAARAVGWALETLSRDLRTRGDLPLDHPQKTTTR